MKKPITLILYNPETNEIERELKTIFVPFGILKKAVALKDKLDIESLNPDDLDTITGIVSATFQDRVSVEEINAKTDISETITVVKEIIGRVNTQDGGRGVPAEASPLK